MRKSIFLLAILSLSTAIHGQEIGQEPEPDKFEVLFSYGLAYNVFHYNPDNDFGELSLATPQFGNIMEFNFDYRLPNNRFIGLGFARQNHQKTITNFDLSRSYGLAFDNYQSTYTKFFYDLHFRKAFENNIHLTLGVFYNVYYHNNFGTSEYQGDFYTSLGSDRLKGDEFGLSLALDYFFPIKDYFEIGIRGKLYYTLVEIETVSLAPVLKFSF